MFFFSLDFKKYLFILKLYKKVFSIVLTIESKIEIKKKKPFVNNKTKIELFNNLKIKKNFSKFIHKK